jgi:hypothetical protein
VNDAIADTAAWRAVTQRIAVAGHDLGHVIGAPMRTNMDGHGLVLTDLRDDYVVVRLRETRVRRRRCPYRMRSCPSRL